MVIGTYLDGWAHDNLVQKEETFFTPWHAVLFSGFYAAIAYNVWEYWRRRKTTLRMPLWYGGKLTLLGAELFAIGIPADFIGHEIWGFEPELAALLSPTHLLMVSGALLMVTAPFRTEWRQIDARFPTWREFAPILMSITLLAAIVSFYTTFLSPFRVQPRLMERVPMSLLPFRVEPRSIDSLPPNFGQRFAEQPQAWAIASVLASTALLISPLLYLLRESRRPPFGSATFFFSVVAVMSSAFDSFRSLPLVLGPVVGGLVADVLFWIYRPSPARPRAIRSIAVATSVSLWLPYFLVLTLLYDLSWEIDLWGGTIYLAALEALAISLLIFPPPSSERRRWASSPTSEEIPTGRRTSPNRRAAGKAAPSR